jgi:hypothetical protein
MRRGDLAGLSSCSQLQGNFRVVISLAGPLFLAGWSLGGFEFGNLLGNFISLRLGGAGRRDNGSQGFLLLSSTLLFAPRLSVSPTGWSSSSDGVSSILANQDASAVFETKWTGCLTIHKGQHTPVGGPSAAKTPISSPEAPCCSAEPPNQLLAQQRNPPLDPLLHSQPLSKVPRTGLASLELLSVQYLHH